MSDFLEQTYWITLAHLPKWGSERVNKLIIKIHQKNSSLEEFFELSENEWKIEYELNPKYIQDLVTAKKSLANNSFLAENLLSQGFEIIPITSKEYSSTLKENLKTKFSPPIFYTKGNKQILHEDSIAIVGSRNASDISLRFTDNVAQTASKEFKVVVSGFAKGVDKQALESALKYKGHSIIVLPQGILTFSSGIKKYYSQIVEGNCLVLSTFHPNSVWSAGLAMARNPIIYGLAKEIFVAQSSNKGGTWEGVKKGLKMGRKIFVRKPEEKEKNANLELIHLGATPVDFDGREIRQYEQEQKEIDTIKKSSAEQAEIGLREIVELLKKTDHTLSAKEISESFNGNINSRKIFHLLKDSSEISKIKSKPIKYSLLKDEGSLFGKVGEDKIPYMSLEESDSSIVRAVELEIVSVEFDGTSDWKFRYNGKIIKVKISDNNFIQKINTSSYGFTKGDLISGDLRLLEECIPERYELVNVIDIKLKFKD